MNEENALVAVRCPVHKKGMAQRPLHRQSAEQRFCGAWWDCQEYGCGCSILFHSAALEAQLAAMKSVPIQGRLAIS